MRIVFDLDGTLADGKHREHLISGETKDWDGYFEACDGDTPMLPAIHTLLALYYSADHQGGRNAVEIWSGRGEGVDRRVREKTINWIVKNTNSAFYIRKDPSEKFFYADARVDLRMRPHGDFTPDNLLKKRWLDEARQQGTGPQLVFDDRNKVVQMWRAEGIPCFQVADGDF